MRFTLFIVALVVGLEPAQALDAAARRALRTSQQVVLDARGQPLIAVRLTESQRRVDFVAEGDFTWLDHGSARGEWRVTVDAGRKGTLKHWVAVGQFGAGQAPELEAARERFPGAEVLVGGAVFGTTHPLDTRVHTLVVDAQPSEGRARRRARAWAAEHDVRTWVVTTLDRPPSGTIVARGPGGARITGADVLWLTGGTAPITFPRLRWGHGTPKRGRAKRSYAGDLYFTVGIDGRLTVVNVLPAERIIEGVVPAEIYPRAPAEALAAQAVAARGQLLAKLSTRHRADPYRLCAETHCQKYTGVTRRDPRTTAAVAATAGRLLFAEAGLVDTVYSSTCGGYREASSQMWSGPPRVTLAGGRDTPSGGAPVADVAGFIDDPPAGAWCAAGSRFRWTREVSRGAVSRGVAKHADIGAVRRIEVVRRGHSGRALAVRYHGERGEHVVRGAYRNRTLLGRLPSGMWVARPQGPAAAPTGWRVRGGGFGHGVGMCQLGAIGMAKAGHDHAAILRHYYPTSRLERAW